MWPVAALELLRRDRPGSLWMRLHARQAAVYGLLGSLLFTIVLALPLFASLALAGASTGTIIAIYGVGAVVDVLLGGALFVITVRYSLRASAGELFDIPYVAELAGRLFPIRNRDQDRVD